MLVTPAFAQDAGAAAPTDVSSMLTTFVPFILIFVIMYFLIIRPQQTRMKRHREMVSRMQRGDTVITSGGIIGRVSKVIDDSEVQVEIAEGVRVRVARAMISEVRAKSEPVKDDSSAKAST